MIAIGHHGDTEFTEIQSILFSGEQPENKAHNVSLYISAQSEELFSLKPLRPLCLCGEMLFGRPLHRAVKYWMKRLRQPLLHRQHAVEGPLCRYPYVLGHLDLVSIFPECPDNALQGGLLHVGTDHVLP